MKSNFKFLEEKWPLLTTLGSTAERYLFSDSNSCLIKLGLFGEAVVNLMFVLDNISEPEPQEENTHANRIKVLKFEGLLPKDIDDGVKI